MGRGLILMRGRLVAGCVGALSGREKENEGKGSRL